MMKKTLIATAFALIATGAYAQGVVRGEERGAREGAHAAGPVGAVVGGAAGAVGGLLGIQERPRFERYVVERHIPSYQYDGPVAVGTVLPPGVTYYSVPARFHVIRSYRYTVVDGRTVIVDPRSNAIVEIIQ